MGPILGPWSQPAQYTPGIWQYAGRRECCLLEGRYCDPGPGQLLHRAACLQICSMLVGRRAENWREFHCDPGPGQLLYLTVCLQKQYAGGQECSQTGRLIW